jgi:hypothetical protein
VDDKDGGRLPAAQVAPPKPWVCSPSMPRLFFSSVWYSGRQAMIATDIAPRASAELATHGRQGSPSPQEVSRRILAVRASWGVRERMHRRREARDRFEQLMATLADREEP